MSLPFRHLFVIRRGGPPSGAKTQQLCDAFNKAGGKFVSLSDDDLKMMVALRITLKGRLEGLEPWLKQRKPLCDIAMFREAGLCADHFEEMPPSARTKSQPRPAPQATQPTMAGAKPGNQEPIQTGPKPTPPASIFIGRRLIGAQPEQSRYLALDLLPRHTAVLAGSGSGKTVLLRRIIEEAALQGVPSIVLDTNNDLARLGDSWPKEPALWDELDCEKAKEYVAKVEVVVWTPGIAGGNPIVLAPMPDFGPVRDDEDELQQTVAMAHASLKPLIGAAGAKGVLKEGVLMHALHYFAKSKSEGLEAFVRLLSDLPSDVSNIDKSAKFAADMSNHIKAEIAKNPLLSFKGSPLDPKSLFTAKDKSKTRISVINFSGLPADDAKQSFVNQLEMALFSWIKQNPTPSNTPLTGLFVMDEAPAQKSTPCKESTIALVAQARKYGLGMIFATQVPKNIDNKIISNCTTHFYGKMNAPATIEAVRELMAAKGGGGADIGSLKKGEFYFTTEEVFPAEKVKTPLCLSYHSQNPLTQEEVIKHAKASI
jgi:hypothetical protein